MFLGDQDLTRRNQAARQMPTVPASESAVLAIFISSRCFWRVNSVQKPATNKMHKTPDPTRLGTVEDISGPTVRIKLEDETVTGLVFVRGEGYRVGQVGSFVRIPAGYIDLFGIVSQVGAGAAPGPPELAPAYGNRWLRVELVGEGGRGRRFERGISQYPSIGDIAHVVTESALATIYAPGDKRSYISSGRVARDESIPAYLALDKLVA